MNGKQKYAHWEEGCELWKKKTSDKIADDACDCMFPCLEIKKKCATHAFKIIWMH